MNEIIKISDLKFKYPNSSFELTIPEFSLCSGQIVLITGSNGCGKTTLSKLCLGLLDNYTGVVITSYSIHYTKLYENKNRRA